jgi:mycoredoxin
MVIDWSLISNRGEPACGDLAMITVYGADWCEDTKRSLRHLRRLAVPHRYLNIDENLDALERALALNGGRRRTPIIDLGLSGPPLVEPDNDTLTGALVEIQMLTQDEAADRMGVQNVGDLERVARTVGGLTLLFLARRTSASVRRPVTLLASTLAVSGVVGWCPAYHYAGVTSLDGPGDRPDEAVRKQWLAHRVRSLEQETRGVEELAR